MKHCHQLSVLLALICCLLLMVALSCQTPPPENDLPGENGDAGDENGGNNDQPTMEMTIYFRNQAYEPGISPAEDIVVPVKREVSALLAGSGDAVKLLLAGPTAEEENQYGAGKIIREDAVILDLFLEEDLLVLNLSYEDPFHPSLSMHHEESAFIEAIVRTATEFSSVKYIWILRDGKPWQAGYLGCCSPLARSGTEMQFTIYYGTEQAIEEYAKGTLTDGSAENILQPVVVSLVSPPGTVEENCPFIKIIQQLTAATEEGLTAPLPADNTALAFDYDLEQRLLTVHLQGSATQSHIDASILTASLIYTFTEIPVIDQLVVTLNGQAWSDGHVEWEEPMGRENF